MNIMSNKDYSTDFFDINSSNKDVFWHIVRPLTVSGIRDGVISSHFDFCLIKASTQVRKISCRVSLGNMRGLVATKPCSLSTNVDGGLLLIDIDRGEVNILCCI